MTCACVYARLTFIIHNQQKCQGTRLVNEDTGNASEAASWIPGHCMGHVLDTCTRYTNVSVSSKVIDGCRHMRDGMSLQVHHDPQR